jgi:hypothetical protein
MSAALVRSQQPASSRQPKPHLDPFAITLIAANLLAMVDAAVTTFVVKIANLVVFVGCCHDVAVRVNSRARVRKCEGMACRNSLEGRRSNGRAAGRCRPAQSHVSWVAAALFEFSQVINALPCPLGVGSFIVFGCTNPLEYDRKE